MSANNGYIGRAPSDSSVVVARQTFNPTGGQTTFTFDSNYKIGYLDAYLNGSRLINASDYTATDGSTVVLGVGATTGDVLECVAYKAFNLGSSVVGVSSAGTVIKGDDVRTLNFIGAGNTFAVNGNTVDISISGGGAGGKWQTDDTNSPPGISTSTNVSIGVTVATSALTVTGDAKLTGVVTATTFIGALTGNVTGNASGTAGGLSGTPSITVQDITAEMVSIGGTLTYEDVTNVDSVGIITAQKDVRVGRNLNVVGVATIGTLDAQATGITTTGITTQTIFSNPNVINDDQLLNTPNHNYGMFGPVTVGAAITVGVGNTFVIV